MQGFPVNFGRTPLFLPQEKKTTLLPKKVRFVRILCFYTYIVYTYLQQRRCGYIPTTSPLGFASPRALCLDPNLLILGDSSSLYHPEAKKLQNQGLRFKCCHENLNSTYIYPTYNSSSGEKILVMAEIRRESELS